MNTKLAINVGEAIENELDGMGMLCQIIKMSRLYMLAYS
jgi:hypothetical protein